MSFIPLQIPPGAYRNGTEYESKGRWFDMNLVRWFEGAMQAVGGWQAVKNSSDATVTTDQPIRAMLGWRDDVGVAFLALGSYCKAWAYSVGVLTEITPAGITCGTKDATVTSGNAYGEGDYGDGPYGGVITDIRNEIVEAGSWTFDNFGELLIGCSTADGKIYEWDLNVVNDFTQVTNSPTAKAIVVTPERTLVALGAAGDRRLIQWSDQDNRTGWTPGPGSFAGDFPLPGSGELMAGTRGKDETLIWTDTDLWQMQFTGGDTFYRFRQAGTNCGLISRHAFASFGSKAIWMGKRGFFTYDGFVREVPSEVGDYVFDDFNTIQRSKVYAVPVSEFGEVWWFYPSANSLENDRYVAFNFIHGFWMFGSLSRTAGIDRSPNQYPLMMEPTSSTVNTLYEHELGTNTGGLVPFAESGPIEIGVGEQVMTITYIIPDDKTLGDVRAQLALKFHPDGPETTFGPFTLSEQTSLRKTARQVRLRVEQVNPGWRVGIPRLDVEPGGRR